MLLVLAVRCGDQSCEETRTCPGPGADASADADSGDGNGTPCSLSTQCDDGLACNGAEDCVAGKCSKGQTFLCDNPDPTHCDVACAESPTGPTCVTTPLDNDADSHGTALCTTSPIPGSDCDDQDPNVFSGAMETCDGFDSDCDGKDDLEEGFAPTGVASDFVSSPTDVISPAVAASPTSNGFGVVWMDQRDGNEEIYFAVMNSSGAKSGSDTRLTNDPAGSAGPRIASNGSSFGVVYSDGRYGNYEILFRRVSADGKELGPEVRVSNAMGASALPDIVRAGSGWFVLWLDQRSGFPQLFGRLLDDAGTALSAETLAVTGTTKPFAPALATSGTVMSAVWTDRLGSSEVPNSVNWSVIDTASTSASALSLGPPPSSVELISDVFMDGGDFGFVSTWVASDATQRRLQAAEIATDGTVVCSAAEIVKVFNSTNISAMGASASARFAALAWLQSDGFEFSIQLARSKGHGACNYLLGPSVVTTNEVIGTIDLATGPSGIAVVWTQRKASDPQRLRARVFGPNFCD